MIDTASVAPEDRLDFWQETISRAYYPLELQKPRDRWFFARVAHNDLCGIKVNRIVSSGLTTLRTPKSIARLDPGTLTLVIAEKGRFVVEQDGRAAVCTPGDLSTCDSSRRFRIHSLSPIEAVTFTIPRCLLQPLGDRLAEQTATRVQPTGPELLATSFLRDLARSLERGEVSQSDEGFAESVLALTRRLGLPAERRNGAHPASAAELLVRVKAYIAANLGDPELGPEQIARAHYISRRHLYNIFKPEGRGVQHWIQEQRLARCAAELQDPRLRDETIQTIAARWGFRSLSHFSRAFRAAYGCSPREYREMVAAADIG